MALLVFIAASIEAYDSSYYTPSAQSKSFQMSPILTLKSSSTTYLTSLATKCGPVLGVGVLFCLIFLIWSCALCCCTPKRSERCLYILFGFFILFFLGLMGILIAALVENSNQTDLITVQFPGVVDFMLKLPLDMIAQVQLALLNVSALATSASGITASVPSCTAGFCNDIKSAISAIDSTVGTLQDSVKSINKTLAGLTTDIQNFRSGPVFSDLRSYDSQRNLGFILAVIIPIIVLSLQLFIVMWNTRYRIKNKDYLKNDLGYGEEPGCKPWAFCNCCISPLFTVLLLIFILILYLVATLLFVVTTISADACKSPYNDIVTLGSLDNTTGFFFTCTDPAQNFPDVATAVTSINKDLKTLNTTLSQLPTLASQIPLASEIPGFLEAIKAFNTAYNNLASVLNNLVSLVNCGSIQGRINALFHFFCDTLYMSFYNCFMLFMSIGCVIVLAEFMRRLVPLKEEDTREEPEKPQGNKGYTDTNPYPPANEGPPEYSEDAVEGTKFYPNSNYAQDGGEALYEDDPPAGATSAW